MKVRKKRFYESYKHHKIDTLENSLNFFFVTTV